MRVPLPSFRSHAPFLNPPFSAYAQSISQDSFSISLVNIIKQKESLWQHPNSIKLNLFLKKKIIYWYKFIWKLFSGMVENHSRRESHTHTHSVQFYLVLHFDSVPSTFRFLLSLPQFFSPPTTSHHQLLQWIFRYFFFSVVHWSGIAHSAVARSNEEKLKISFPLFFFLNTLLYLRFTLPPVLSQNKTKRSTNISEPTTQ